jgi:hypothetical protein
MSDQVMTDGPTNSTALPAADLLGRRLAAITSARRSRLNAVLLPVSAVAMVAGIGVGIAAYFVSHLTSDPLVQRDAIVMALAATAFTVASSSLFAVLAITSFLRFWLARLIYTLDHEATTAESGRD